MDADDLRQLRSLLRPKVLVEKDLKRRPKRVATSLPKIVVSRTLDAIPMSPQSQALAGSPLETLGLLD